MIVLTTPRLLIRDHLPGDLPYHHELLSSDSGLRYLPELKSHTLTQTRENLAEAIRQQGLADRRCYFFWIESRETGSHIGEIGYTVTKKTPLGALADVGYFIRESCWGHGYTSEALREVLRFAFEENGVYRISCGCLKENAASRRVMEKCGLLPEGELKEYQWHEGALKDRLVFRLLRQEWQRLQGQAQTFTE